MEGYRSLFCFRITKKIFLIVARITPFLSFIAELKRGVNTMENTKKVKVKAGTVHLLKGRFEVTDNATGESLGTFDSMEAAFSFCNENFILVEGFTGGRFEGVFVPGTFQALRECFKGWKTPGRNMVKACNAVSLEAFKSEIRLKILEAALGHYKALKGEINDICGG